jgi:hypothetical protein
VLEPTANQNQCFVNRSPWNDSVSEGVV